MSTYRNSPLKLKGLFFLLAFCLFVNFKPLNGQDVDISDLIEKAIAANGSTAIGYFVIYNKAQVTYSNPKPGTARIKTENIEKVEIHVNEGFISNIRAYVGKKVFTNTKAPISLVRFLKRNDALFDKDNNSISLHSVIYYFDNIRGSYLPTEYTKSDMEPGKLYNIKEDNSLNALIDFRVYSDLLGLINEEENGILQLETKAKFFLNTTNRKEKDWIYFKDLEAFINLSRFDNSDGFVLLEEINNDQYLISTPIELFQKSYINIGGDLNLLSIGSLTKHVSFRINGGMGVNLSKTKKPNVEDYIDYNTFSFNFQGEIEARRLENFGLNLKMGYLNVHPLDVKEINTFDPISILKTTAEVDYFLANQREKAFFVRFNYFDNLDHSLGNFYQLQVGYKAPLSLKTLKGNGQ